MILQKKSEWYLVFIILALRLVEMVHRTILEKRREIRDNFLGSKRKMLQEQNFGISKRKAIVNIIEDQVKRYVDDYLEQRNRENEAECPEMTEEGIF